MCDSGACQLKHEHPGKFDRSQVCDFINSLFNFTTGVLMDLPNSKLKRSIFPTRILEEF